MAEDVKVKSGLPGATIKMGIVTASLLAGSVAAFGAPVGTGGNSGALGWGDSTT